MPARYKLISRHGPVGTGVMASQFVAVSGVAKSSNASHPFVVPCELTCGQLGRVLGLPVPPGFIIEDGTVLWHVSLDFNLSGQQLPPADPAALVQCHPRLAAGIVVFDSWIVNADRHPNNLSFDQVTGAVHLFDHSHAFYATQNGRQYLEQLRNQSLAANNCITPHLTDLADIRFWIDRITAVPDFVIEDAIEAAISVGLLSPDGQFCIDYLRDRLARLPDLLFQDQTSFRGIAPHMWAQF